MTVRELIDSNACIVEAYITLRGDYDRSIRTGEREFYDALYVHEFAVGSCASFGRNPEERFKSFGKGERGRKAKKPYTLIKKELNARADRDYWNVKTKVIPKQILDLEVGQWSTGSAYSWIDSRTQRGGYESAQKIEITVYLPKEAVREVYIPAEDCKQIEGQISLLEMCWQRG